MEEELIKCFLTVLKVREMVDWEVLESSARSSSVRLCR